MLVDAMLGDVLIRRVELPAVAPHERTDRIQRSQAGHTELRMLVAQLAGVDPAQVLIEARCPDCGGPHGRPVVMGPVAARDVRVSLAYAGTSIIAAASSRAAIGVDAELRAPDAADAADDRREAVRTLAPAPHDEADPLRQWTRIEAVLKADGRGLRVDPHAVTFAAGSDGLLATVAGGDRRYAVRDVPLGADLYITVAREA
jgi:4'-phosphopantetheinyl transferase